MLLRGMRWTGNVKGSRAVKGGRHFEGRAKACAAERRCCVEMAAGEMAAETVVGMTVAEVKVAEMPVRDIVRE